MELVCFLLAAVAAYLIGSIPSGYLLARSKGVDIRTVGSGNIGATNVLRTLGRTAGILVLVMDAFKGWVAVVFLGQIFFSIFRLTPGATTREWCSVVAGVGALLGHNYTCWLGFRGGKGIATSAGVLLALVPWALAIILSLWVIIFALTRYVSLASVLAAAALPLASWLTHESLIKIILTGVMGALAIYKHKGNIQRLFQGTELRFGSRPKEGAK